VPGPLAVLEALPLAAAALTHRREAGVRPLWTPLPGPQVSALDSPADELFYGGGAGGGKSDLLLGYGLTRARHGIVFRRQFRQLLGPERLIERSKAIVGRPELFNHTQLVWRLPGGRMLEFGAVDHEDDKAKYQGRAHDFKGFDEVAQFSESQYLFLIGWARTSQPGQRVRVIACGNPPQSADGEWVIQRWAPWLNPQHPDPAEPGELRWYATLDGQDRECEDGAPFDWKGELVTPRSRTFIPARLADNPHLEATGYRATLQGLPSRSGASSCTATSGSGCRTTPGKCSRRPGSDGRRTGGTRTSGAGRSPREAGTWPRAGPTAPYWRGGTTPGTTGRRSSPARKRRTPTPTQW
jgi:hypothetical protein